MTRICSPLCNCLYFKGIEEHNQREKNYTTFFGLCNFSLELSWHVVTTFLRLRLQSYGAYRERTRFKNNASSFSKKYIFGTPLSLWRGQSNAPNLYLILLLKRKTERGTILYPRSVLIVAYVTFPLYCQVIVRGF